MRSEPKAFKGARGLPSPDKGYFVDLMMVSSRKARPATIRGMVIPDTRKVVPGTSLQRHGSTPRAIQDSTTIPVAKLTIHPRFLVLAIITSY